jgi:zinc transport system substrate-binding protein
MLNFKTVATAAICIFCFLTGCGKATPNEPKKTSVVVTTVPLCDWTRAIAGKNADDIEITVLQDSGGDLHDYRPSARDIVAIGKADLFVCIGGVSDAWVPGVLRQSENKKRKTASALELVKDSIAKECRGACSHRHGDHRHGHDSHACREETPDEHIWLSLRLAKKICMGIAAALAESRPDRKDAFLENAKAYCRELDAIDASFSKHAASATNKTILVADRFPFVHFTNDYGLGHFAAFEGCSAEIDASFHTVMALSKTLVELNLPAIYTIEGSDSKIAKRIVETSGRKETKILRLDSMQNVSLKEFDSLGGYTGIMKKNIEAIKSSVR